ncbi:hypothetical protein [Streptomyces kanamyceticus]|uniref:Uncharacterized protein n=1 Tax=Streptomyces kanamyceticus TaxID=1967 RepID=A0A5J6GFB7_STRKN|nr:hypothetical protein [Streptomyces kanamyceticus]QEU92555.1 hypothetical protein CP970_18060 [Streptomyces kanamyceticus]
MLAREYGYRVLPRKAIDTASTARYLGVWRQKAEVDHRATRRRTVPLYMAFTLILCVMAAGITDSGPLTFLTVFVMLGVWPFADDWSRAQGARPLAQARELLTASPWQVWPCRVERTPHNPQMHLVHLLSPDREVVRTFVGRMPEDAWLSMTDGRGIVLVCGDLRFPVAMATKRGRPVWLGQPIPTPARPDAASAQPPGPVDELIRQAGQDAVSNWLNDLL